MARQAAGHLIVVCLTGIDKLHVHNGSPWCLPCAQTARPRHPAAAMLEPGYMRGCLFKDYKFYNAC